MNCPNGAVGGCPVQMDVAFVCELPGFLFGLVLERDPDLIYILHVSSTVSSYDFRSGFFFVEE